MRAAAEAEASRLQEELAAKEQAHRAREQELQAAKEESLAATASHLQDKLNHEAKENLETELAKATARHEEELHLRLAAEASTVKKKLAAEHEAEVASLLSKEAAALEQAETERGALVAALKEEHGRTLQSKLQEVQEELSRTHAEEVALLQKAATDKALEAERSTKEQQLELRKEATALLRETHEKELLEVSSLGVVDKNGGRPGCVPRVSLAGAHCHDYIFHRTCKCSASSPLPPFLLHNVCVWWRFCRHDDSEKRWKPRCPICRLPKHNCRRSSRPCVEAWAWSIRSSCGSWKPRI